MYVYLYLFKKTICSSTTSIYLPVVFKISLSGNCLNLIQPVVQSSPFSHPTHLSIIDLFCYSIFIHSLYMIKPPECTKDISKALNKEQVKYKIQKEHFKNIKFSISYCLYWSVGCKVLKTSANGNRLQILYTKYIFASFVKPL